MKRFIICMILILGLFNITVSEVLADKVKDYQWIAGSIWFWSGSITTDEGSNYVEYSRSKVLFKYYDDIDIFSVASNKGHYLAISTDVRDPRATTWSRVKIVYLNTIGGRQAVINIAPEDVIFNEGSTLIIDTSIATTDSRIIVYPQSSLNKTGTLKNNQEELQLD